MTTITIGLDGADWTFLDEWIDDGILPNLRRLHDSGVGGTSRSCLPPLTVPNWKCYATGKNPGKFDVFRFDRIDTKNRTHTFHDATDFKSPELWDYLNEAGYTAGVINKPSTYPPKSIDGFVVAGGPDAADGAYRSLERGYTQPPSLAAKLEEEYDYRVHPSPMISPADTGEAEIEAILELIQSRFDAAIGLLDSVQPDFLHLTVFYTMALQHYFYRDEPVKRAWSVIDRNLGRLLDQGHDLLIMSDHGTADVETVFYVNVWLEAQGLLRTNPSIDSALRSVGLTRERALSTAKRLGLVEVLSETVPERLQQVLPWDEGVKRDRILSLVDWDRTVAIASTQGPIYLTIEPDSPRYEPLRSKLIDALSDLTHPKTGTQLVEAVHRGEEYYEGLYAENAPDLILEYATGVHASDAIGPETWYDSTGVWRGGNDPHGIFLFSGPSFLDSSLDRQAAIVDLAPTLLHALDVPIPTDMDGSVLDVFVDERPVRTQPPLASTEEEATAPGADVADRLADLGYLE